MRGFAADLGATQGNGVRADRTASRPGAPCQAGVDPREIHGVQPPTTLNRIVIVGAGGFGREVLHWVRDAWPAWMSRVAGFLAADPQQPARAAGGPPVIGDPLTFDPRPGDGLLLAIGIPGVRRRIAESLMARGARFLTLIHPTAIVAPTASLGEGSILCPYSIVSDSARLGRHVLLNYHASLGHDATAGDFAVLSPYAALGGNAHVGEEVFLGMHACVGPGKTLGPRGKVSANSCALADAPADSIVFGVPGRIARRVPIGTDPPGAKTEAASVTGEHS